MIKKFLDYLINFYVMLFSKKIFIGFHYLLMHISQRSLGYKNFGNFNKTGEKNFLKKIKKYEIKTSIDIGANKGDYSKEIIINTNSFVIAFEPMKKSFLKLKKIEKKFSNKIKCFNIALSDKNGENTIYFQNQNSELASFEKNIRYLSYIKKQNIKSKKIKVLKLDTFVKKENRLFKKGIDFITIDTEGYDYEVLMGSLKTINKFRPKFIQFEMNWHYLFRGINIFKICLKLQNYYPYRLLPYNSGLIEVDQRHPNHNIFHLSNFIMIRKDIKFK